MDGGGFVMAEFCGNVKIAGEISSMSLDLHLKRFPANLKPFMVIVCCFLKFASWFHFILKPTF